MAAPHLRSRLSLRAARTPFRATRLTLQRTSNSPDRQLSSSWLEVNNCVCSPVSGSLFFEIAVRTLEWKGCVARFMTLLPVLFVCMAAMFGFPIHPVHVHFLENRI